MKKMNLQKIEQYPTKVDVLKSITKLNNTEFPKFKNGESVSNFADKISKILLNEFGFLINPKQLIDSNIFFSKFYRVRELDSFTNIDLIREHSYPPIDNVTMGRCNFPGFPVFYCSNNPLTSLLEVARTFQGSSNKYCISKWELVPTNEEIIFENFLQVELPDENEFSKIKENIQNKISDPFEKSLNKRLSREQEEGIIEYLKYLDNSFIKDEDYSVSASLAYRALYVNHKFRTDVLMYPSVQTVFKGINFAIQPNFVENNLKLKRLYIVRFDKFDPLSGRISISFSKYGVVEKSIITWKSINLDDKYYTQVIKEDFGDYGGFFEEINNLPTDGANNENDKFD